MKRDIVVWSLALAIMAPMGAAPVQARPRKKVKTTARKTPLKKTTVKAAPVKAAPAQAAPVKAKPAAFDDWMEDTPAETKKPDAAPKIVAVAATDDGNMPSRSEEAKPLPKNADGTLRTGVNITPVTRNAKDSAETIELAQGQRALQPIVLSENASQKTKDVAAELKKYLDKMTGASFEIKTGDGTSGIVLGTIKEFPNPSLGAALEITHAFDGKEAFAIRTMGKRLLLIGATDRAVSHAAFKFLEEEGCRWFFNSDNWEVIPRKTSLTFARDITDRPSFLARDIWYAWYFFNDSGHPGNTDTVKRSSGSDHGAWIRHNLMGGSFTANTGHAYDTIVRENATAFAAHPEYFALVGGKRQGNQLEIGNPDLVKLVCDWAVDYFKKNPDSDMISVDPADGGGMSESEESKKLGTASNNAFYLANQVAKALQKAYPGQNKMVGMYAYNWHSDPPPFALEPNVYIQLTMGFNGGLLTLDQLFEEWPKKAKNLGFYDYYSTWRWDYDMWPGGRVGNKAYSTDMIRRFQKANAASGAYATSISAESSNNWGVNGRGYYLASKLMWNPDVDPEKVLEDFYDKAFGPAAAAMKDYYDLQDNVPPMSPGVVGALFRRLGKARDIAKNGDPAIMRRIDDITNYLHYYDWNYRNGRETDAKKRDQRTLEIQTYMYRNRYSYMNHWEAFRQDSIHEDMSKPDTEKPWKVNKPITPEETEAWFQDGLKFYPELKIPELIKYSKNLVPVSLGGDTKGYQSQSIQGGSQEYAFYSIGGQPIRATLTSFAMYGGPKQSYSLTGEDGKVIVEGAMTGLEKGLVTEINAKVPKPGRYTLRYTDGSGSLYNIKVPADQPFALQLDKLNGSTALYGNTPDLYFYVPKGTQEINYYFARTPWSNSGPHDVIAPDGKIVATFLDKNGDYLTVPVPPGMDGKVWHMGSPKGSSQGFGLGYFHFFNVPDLMSPSPGLMLLPEDVVKKDGLKRVG